MTKEKAGRKLREIILRLFILINAFVTVWFSLPVFAVEKWHPCFKTSHKRKSQSYVSPDGGLRATIVGIGKKYRGNYYESRVQVRTTHGKLVFQASFGSPDNEQGYGVVCIGWTPDSQFFVWSMASSGGHQAGYFPAFFYSRRLDRAFSFIDTSTSASYKGAIAVNSFYFSVKYPDVIKGMQTLDEVDGIPFTVRLSKLKPYRPTVIKKY